MAQLSDDCFAFGGSLLPIDGSTPHDLRARRGRGRGRTRRVAQAAGRTLAEDVIAGLAIPGFANSAVDGYAVRFDDLDRRWPRPAGRAAERIAARAFAGRPAGCRGRRPHLHRRDHARRRRHGDHAGGLPGEDGIAVFIRPGIRRGANRRLAGEDIPEGAVALRPAGGSGRPISGCSLRWARPRCRCDAASRSACSRPATKCASRDRR